jgi:selenocysteine-specific elongation factor
MPQTREHFDICRLLRIPQGIVVLTKADVADAETRALVREDVRELVAGSFLEGAPVVEVSAPSSDGLDALRAALVEAAARVGVRPSDGAARLPIDRVFSMRGFGTVVTGTLVAGRVSVDDELRLLPGDRSVKVRGVQVHGAATAHAVAGQRTALNLGGVGVADVSRGQTLAAPRSLSVTRRIDAAIDLLPDTRPLKHGARVRFHTGTAEVLGRVSLAGAGGADIVPGGHALVRLRLEREAVVTRGDRFILRAYSPPITIGGGWVLDPAPARAAIRTADARASLERLEATPGRGPGDVPALVELIAATGLPGLDASSVVARGGVAPAALAPTIKALEEQGVIRAGDRLVDGRLVLRVSGALVKLITAFHQSNPLSEGLPREEARERIFAKADASVFELVLQRLKQAGVLAGTDRLALASHRAAGSDADAKLKAAVLDAYRAGGLKPPDVSEVAAACAADRTTVEKIAALLVREKTLVRVDTLLFHQDALGKLKADIAGLKATAAAGRATVDVATFKNRYGVTRKFAIPLLEYLDRERVTRRTGDVRLVL